MISGIVMYKVAFISANNFQVPYPVYPIGVSYLMTYVKSHFDGCLCSLFDFNLDGGYDEFARWCKSSDFDVFAVSLRNMDDVDFYSKNLFLDHYQKILHIIRDASSAPVVVGGPAFSIFPLPLFEALNPDFGIIGEGEDSLCGLLDALFYGKSPVQVDRLVYRDAEGKIVMNPRRHNVESPCLRMEETEVDYYFRRSGMLNVQTKRGCPFHCMYCTYPLIDGREVRNLGVDSVIDNILQMNSRFGADYLFFTDSVFNVDREYNEELCARIIESGVRISWGAYFNPNNLSRKDLELYKKAGLTHIEWGTDTLADETLETYGKSFSWEDIRSTSQWASDLGIFYAHFMILGGYGETERTLDQTFERSRELGFTVFFPYVGMRIYPNTRLREIAVSQGLVSPEDDLVRPAYYVSKEIDVNKLKERASRSGTRWVFSDEGESPVVARMRARHKRGPLWEYLRYK